MDTIDLDIGEIAAVITVLGALAAILSADDGGGSTRPVIDIPANFGQSGDSGSNSDTDDSTSGWDGDSPATEPADETNTDPTSGEWQYEDPEDNPNSSQYEDPNLDFGDATPSTDEDDYEFGGATGDNPTGTDSGTDGSTGGASPGDTTTGGTTPVGDTGVSYDDVASVGDHLAGSTDEWVGGLW